MYFIDMFKASFLCSHFTVNSIMNKTYQPRFLPQIKYSCSDHLYSGIYCSSTDGDVLVFTNKISQKKEKKMKYINLFPSGHIWSYRGELHEWSFFVCRMCFGTIQCSPPRFSIDSKDFSSILGKNFFCYNTPLLYFMYYMIGLFFYNSVHLQNRDGSHCPVENAEEALDWNPFKRIECTEDR